MDKLAIIIRGNIRNSFDNLILLSKINLLKQYFDIDIYIQSWNQFEAKQSWRYLKKIDGIVTENTILKYFNLFQDDIKKIIILNDAQIDITGVKEGGICNSKMPLLNWKYMNYGIYSILEYMKNTNIKYNKVLNFRFDLFNHDLSKKNLIIDNDYIIDKINNYDSTNLFLFSTFIKTQVICVDNIFLSNLDFMYKLYKKINYNLDNIIIKNPNIWFQESIILFESLYLNNFYKYIVFGFNDEINNYLIDKKICSSDVIVITNNDLKISYDIIKCNDMQIFDTYNLEKMICIINKDLLELKECVYSQIIII